MTLRAHTLLAVVLACDLVVVNRAAPAAAPAPSVEFAVQVAEHFGDWDRDESGALSVAEIDRAVADPTTTGAAAAAVAALRRAVRGRQYTLPPLTRANLRALAFAPPAPSRPNLSRMYAEGRARLGATTSRDLFASGLPRLDTIHQGRLGNCFCLAPLGAMVHRDPKQVAGLFVLQKDGSYCVKLGHRPVHVAPPTDAEVALTASNEHDGVWVNLYEKAVGTALNQERPPDQRSESPIDVLGHGGSAGRMVQFITGNKIRRFSCGLAADPALDPADRAARLDELRGQLTAASRANRLITCGTLKNSTPGLSPYHAYAVLAYDAQADALRLWNPHGGQFTPKGPEGRAHGYARTDGVFTVPLGEFVEQFSGLAFETGEPDNVIGQPSLAR